MGNVPPQAIDIEEAVLGAMMVNTDSVEQLINCLEDASVLDVIEGIRLKKHLRGNL